MNDLQVFNNPDFGSIRTTVIGAEPWAVGKDVAVALGYTYISRALAQHVDPDDKMGGQNVTPSVTDSMGRVQHPVWINESGIYSLIFSSKLPTAKQFKRWVTSEVLPALRKTGTYSIAPADPPIAPQRAFTADDYLRAASIIATCRNERLPYVLGFLAQGGFQIPEVQAVKERDTEGECARLINKAVNDFGLSVSAIGKLTGLATTQITRIRTGMSVPKLNRAKLIIDAIKTAIPEIEEA